MNILILTSEYPNDLYPRPDWTWVVSYFAREWVKQGHRVIAIVDATRFPHAFYGMARIFSSAIARVYDISKIASAEDVWSKEMSFHDMGVEAFNLPMIKFYPGARFSNHQYKTQYKKICRVLSDHHFSPDVITGHWINPQLRLVYELQKKYHCKTGFIFHADYTKDKCKKFNVNKYLPTIDAVGCRSSSAANEIRKYIQTKKPPFICYSGIPDAFVKEYIEKEKNHLKFKSNKMRILSVGRLVNYKRFDTIITACAQGLGVDDYCLRIFGEGPKKTELLKLIDTYHSGNNIDILDKVPRDELQNSMADSDVFVLVSEHETFGLVYLEAMLQGCIVIASKFGGIDGIINDGVNGFLCQEGDAEALLSCLKKIQELTTDEKRLISCNATETALMYTDSFVATEYLNNILKE